MHSCTVKLNATSGLVCVNFMYDTSFNVVPYVLAVSLTLLSPFCVPQVDACKVDPQ